MSQAEASRRVGGCSLGMRPAVTLTTWLVLPALVDLASIARAEVR